MTRPRFVLVLVAATALGASAFGTVPASDPSPALDTAGRLFGRVHPMLVHFPIALVITAAIAEILGRFRRRPADAPPGPRPVTATGFSCIALAALFAGLAAWSGWTNAEREPQGEEVARLLFFHRWFGVALASMVLLAFLAALVSKASDVGMPRRLYRAGLFVAAVLVAVTGHLGGSLVYGDDYLTSVFRTRAEPATAVAVIPTPAATPPANDPDPAAVPVPVPDPAAEPVSVPEPKPVAMTVSFDEEVGPLLVARCARCHGPRRQRSNLRLDSHASIFARPESDWVVVPGAPDESELLRRITLPESDESAMPPGGPPLNAAEVALVRTWITEGARAGAVGVAPAPAAADDAAPPPADPAPDPAPAPPPEEPERDPVTAPPPGDAVSPGAPDRDLSIELDTDAAVAQSVQLAALSGRGLVAQRVAETTHAVDVRWPATVPVDVAWLEGLEPTLVWLDLSRTDVDDAGAAMLAAFVELRRIRLGETTIGDAALAAITALPRLEVLDLHGTAVTDDGIDTLAEAATLRRVYLWDTEVTDAGAERLRAARPDLEVDIGVLPPTPAPAGGEDDDPA